MRQKAYCDISIFYMSHKNKKKENSEDKWRVCILGNIEVLFTKENTRYGKWRKHIHNIKRHKKKKNWNSCFRRRYQKVREENMSEYLIVFLMSVKG